MTAQEARGMVDLRCSLSMRPLTVITWCGNAAPRVALATGGRQGSAAATSQAIVLTPGTPRLSAALCRVRQGADDARAPVMSLAPLAADQHCA
jgi:hypothetical protein